MGHIGYKSQQGGSGDDVKGDRPWPARAIQSEDGEGDLVPVSAPSRFWTVSWGSPLDPVKA